MHPHKAPHITYAMPRPKNSSGAGAASIRLRRSSSSSDMLVLNAREAESREGTKGSVSGPAAPRAEDTRAGRATRARPPGAPAGQRQLGARHHVGPRLAVKGIRQVLPPPAAGVDAARPLLQAPPLVGPAAASGRGKSERCALEKSRGGNDKRRGSATHVWQAGSAAWVWLCMASSGVGCACGKWKGATGAASTTYVQRPRRCPAPVRPRPAAWQRTM